MSDVSKLTASQIGNRICASGMLELGLHVQSELQHMEYLRFAVAKLTAEVKLLKDQLPPEAKAAAAKKLHEAWLRYTQSSGGGRRAPAISDG
jgi:hypothetical protein